MATNPPEVMSEHIRLLNYRHHALTAEPSRDYMNY